MKRGKHQYELGVVGMAAVFNLAGQCGDDPLRVERERWDRERRERDAREYAAKMQLSLEKCPGFAGCDAPVSETGQGRVIVEPGRIGEAMPWLKRRFHVNENLDLSPDNGLCIEIKPRVRSKSVCANRGARVPVTFERPTQFELGLNTETEI